MKQESYSEVFTEVKNLKKRVYTLEENERETMKMMVKMSVKQDQIFDNILEMKKDILSDIQEIKEGGVLKVEFQPIEKWVNTLIYLIVTSVVLALIGLVVLNFKQ